MTTNLPAERRQLTAVERAQVEREKAKNALVALVRENREDIERSLRVYEIDPDRFLAAIEVGIAQGLKASDDFCTGNQRDFLAACARAAHVGLLPDGKQGAIVKYGPNYNFQPMVEGFVEVVWKTGLVTDVNHNVVCEGDEFDFEEGDQGFVRHKRSLTRAADAKVIGAWCVINLKTGGKLIEIVDQVDLEKIANVNASKKGPRGAWAREMHRKAPFRRIVKRLPKTERLSVLIDVDDRNVRLEDAHAADEPAIPRNRLFDTKAAVRGRKPKAPEDVIDPPAPDDVPVHEVGIPTTEPDGEDPPIEGDGDEMLGEADADPAGEPPYVLRAKMRPGKGKPPTEFESVEFWYGDISNMMRRLKDNPDELLGFWALNRPFIDEAGKNGHPQAALRLIELAQELGVIKETNHAR